MDQPGSISQRSIPRPNAFLASLTYPECRMPLKRKRSSRKREMCKAVIESRSPFCVNRQVAPIVFFSHASSTLSWILKSPDIHVSVDCNLLCCEFGTRYRVRCVENRVEEESGGLAKGSLNERNWYGVPKPSALGSRRA